MSTSTSRYHPTSGHYTGSPAERGVAKIEGQTLKVKDRCHVHTLAGILAPNVERTCDICQEKFEHMWRFACAACDFDVHMSCLTAHMPLPPYLTDARHGHELVLSSQSRSGTAYVCHVCHRPGRTWVYECPQCSPLVSIHPDCVRINTTQHSQAGHWLRLDFVNDGHASCDAAYCPRPNQLGDKAALSCAIASWSEEPDCPYLTHFDCANHSLAPFDPRSQVGVAMEQGLARKIEKLKNGSTKTGPQNGWPAPNGQLRPLETYMSHLQPFGYPSSQPPHPFSPHTSHLTPTAYPYSQPSPPGYPPSQPPASQPPPLGYPSSPHPSGYPSSQPGYPSSQPPPSGYPSSQHPTSQPPPLGYPSSQPPTSKPPPSKPPPLGYLSSQPPTSQPPPLGYPSSQPPTSQPPPLGYPSSKPLNNQPPTSQPPPLGYPSSQPPAGQPPPSGYPSSQPPTSQPPPLGYPSSQPPTSQPLHPGYPSSQPSPFFSPHPSHPPPLGYPSSQPPAPSSQYPPHQPPLGYPSNQPHEPGWPRPGTPQGMGYRPQDGNNGDSSSREGDTKIVGGELHVKDPSHDHVLEGELETTANKICNVCRGDFPYMWKFSCAPCDFDAHLSCLSAPMRLPPYLTDARHGHGLVLRPRSSGKRKYRCNACGERGHTWVYECPTCSPLVSLHPDCVRINTTCHPNLGHWLRLDFRENSYASCDVAGCPHPERVGHMAGLKCGISSWTNVPECDFFAHTDCVANQLAAPDPGSPYIAAMKLGVAEKMEASRSEQNEEASRCEDEEASYEAPEKVKRKARTAEEAIRALNIMVGLASVKSFVLSLHAQIVTNKARKQQGLKMMDIGTLHMMFVGNPGTGKTMVARLVAELLNSLGLLAKGHLVEADRSSLVAIYEGQTAVKTTEVFEKAIGGVLFVDEAYTLSPKETSGADFGAESLATLMKLMEDHRDEIVVIFAGYRKEMDVMISTNSGLRSRFPTMVKFEDYTGEELMTIATQIISKDELKLTADAWKLLEKELHRMASLPPERKRENGNVRAVRNILDQTKRRMSLRMAQNPGSDLQTILDVDFETPSQQAAKLQSPEQALAQLNAVIGIASVKEHVRSLRAQIDINNRRKAAGLPVTDGGALHMIFTGNPGTGKTMIARIVAELLKSLGLLRSGHLVEADRSSLVGGFTGQTAIKTQQVIRSALGGVLFVDEAYTLVPKDAKEDYGSEALATLMKSMEDNRDDLVVILAGYQEEMDLMMSANPGVRSRFPTILNFEDYSPENLLAILESMLGKEHLMLSARAREHVWRRLVDLSRLPTEKKREAGNGRAVRNMIEGAKRKQAQRLFHFATDNHSLQTLEDVDFY